MMGIGSIQDYSLYLRNYHVPTITSVSVDDVKAQDANKDLVVASSSSSAQTSDYERAPRKDAPVEDIALSFAQKNSAGAIGKDKDINALDITSVSEDSKDKVLQQYQFFAGKNAGALVNSDDGLVVAKYFQ